MKSILILTSVFVFSASSAFAVDNCSDSKISLSGEVDRYEQENTMKCREYASFGSTPIEKEYYICSGQDSTVLLRFIAEGGYWNDCMNWTYKTLECSSESSITENKMPKKLTGYLAPGYIYDLRVKKHWDYQCE